MTYYYLKQKVSLGDIIDFKGLKVEVTDNLVKSNPDLFVVEEELLPKYWGCVDEGDGDGFTLGKIYKIQNRDKLNNYYNFIDDNGEKNGWSGTNYKHFKPSTKEAFDRQELLEEAKRRYPVGTRFRSVYDNTTIDIVRTTNFYWWGDSHIVSDTPNGCSIYKRGEWAEILTPLFQTEDGVDIYEGDKYYSVYKETLILADFGKPQSNGAASSTEFWITFSTKKAAEEYVAKNKPKDLQYYEDLLLNPVETHTDYTFCTFNSTHYDWLKNKEPKLYWLKVLELIQQDLDNGWKPDWNDHNCKYRIENYYMSNYFIESYRGYNSGLCNFKSKESAQTAIQIMGDKLDIIFK